MIDAILSYIAPHYCCKCGKIGDILCQNCKKYITNLRYVVCLLCGRPAKNQAFCRHCRGWCLTTRTGAVESIINDVKFRRTKSGVEALADILDDAMPACSSDIVLVPVPTAPSNIRRRGYDHMALIAKRLAKRRQLLYVPLLRRRTNVTQHFAKTAVQRREQAKAFFEIAKTPDPHLTYVIIDDIYTTGSTLKAARKCLKDAGVKHIRLVAITRQVNEPTSDGMTSPLQSPAPDTTARPE